MSDIFQEINQSLLYERVIAIWRNHRLYIIRVIGILIVATSTYSVWSYFNGKAINDDSFVLSDTAMTVSKITSDDKDRDEKLNKAFESYMNIALNSTSSTYSDLAYIYAANIKMSQNDIMAAVNLYDNVKDDSHPVLLNLARLLAAHALINTDSPAATKYLDQINQIKFVPQAEELRALIMLKDDNKTGARAALDTLAKNKNLLPDTKERVNDLLAALGGALPDPSKTQIIQMPALTPKNNAVPPKTQTIQLTPKK